MARHTGMRAGALLAATALAGGLLASHPAAAQDASQLQAIQQEISQLQAQLRRLQREAAARDRALKQAQADATQARAEASQAMQRAPVAAGAGAYTGGTYAPGTYAQGAAPATGSRGGGGFSLGSPNPNASSLQSASPASVTTTSVDANNPTFRLGGVSVTLGGFLDTTALYRSRDETAGTATTFSGIPYPNSVNAHINEFRMTSQPSRFSMLVQGKPGLQTNLAGYIELDLNSAATSANSVQTNGYNPRIRLAYAQYDNSALGLHLLAGQDWSLAVGNLVGITPRKESIPPVIDADYLPGFVYTRGPQIRVVKDFGGKLWLGASLEAPQETYSFAGATAATSVPNLVLPNGQSLTFNSLGTSYLNSTASYSYDVAPDMIVKAAVDPGYGHYEAYGLGRFFRTRTSVLGAGDTRTVFGGGVGGSTVIPIVPKYVDFTGNVLAGYGVGRYGSGQLPDASFKANGEPAPLPEIIGMAGIVAHPVKSVDLYTFVGTEQIGRSSFTTGKGAKTAGFGYGTSFVATAGCETELAACSAQTRALDDVSVGGWWRFLHGNFGTVQAGAEYSYAKKIAFHGVGGRPTTDENIVFFSLRYLPFQ